MAFVHLLNIYLRNASPNNDLGNFYGRFLGSISNNFDYKYAVLNRIGDH